MIRILRPDKQKQKTSYRRPCPPPGGAGGHAVTDCDGPGLERSPAESGLGVTRSGCSAPRPGAAAAATVLTAAAAEARRPVTNDHGHSLPVRARAGDPATAEPGPGPDAPGKDLSGWTRESVESPAAPTWHGSLSASHGGPGES